MSVEIWRPCPGFEDLYQVSSLGRVMRIEGQTKGRIMRGHINSTGYRNVTLCRKNMPKIIYVHALVCLAWHGPKPKDKDEVAHLDGSKLNNTPQNLRWSTYAENYADRIRHERVGHKLKSADIKEIFLLKKDGVTQTKIAAKFNVTQSYISDIVNGKYWKHLYGDL